MKNIRKKHLILLQFLIISFSIVFSSAAFAKIEKGSTKAEVIEVYGNPSGIMNSGKEEILSYPGGMIVLIDGVVDQIDANFEIQLEQRKNKDEFDAAQNAKGLTEHQGSWITKAKKQEIKRDKTSQQKIIVFKNGGKLIDLKDLLVPGKVTLIDFYADWCGPCKQISPNLENLAKHDPDVYLRKIDIVKWKTPVTKQYGIKSIPDVRVFDRNGRMIGKPSYNINEIIYNIGQVK